MGLESGKTSAKLTIRDNGRGFPADRPAGHGRRIMLERAESIGATLEVSELGAGTEVKVSYGQDE